MKLVSLSNILYRRNSDQDLEQWIYTFNGYSEAPFGKENMEIID